MSIDYTAQAIGIIASGMAIFAFSHKSDKRFKIIIAMAAFTFALHFFLLGAYVGAAVNLINSLRAGLSLRFHNSNIIMIGFILVYLVAGVFGYQNPQDVLAVLSGCLGTFGMYKLSGIKLRVCLGISSVSWLIHDSLYRSIGGVATELFIQATNAITIFRLHRDKKKKEHGQNT